MKVISMHEQNEALVRAEFEHALREGLIVAGPTDTVYGVFANAADERAVDRLFAIKGRRTDKAISVFVKDIKMARWHAYISDTKARFLERIWPGAVTVVFHHKEKLPGILTGEGETLGLRIPAHPFLREVLEHFNAPLAQSSANPSGFPPAHTAEEVVAYFEKQEEKPDLLIDGGEVNGAPSAVLDYTTNTIMILRAGSTGKEELLGLLGELEHHAGR